jgi:hypothetical protein
VTEQSRTARIGKNEALFREVNESIRNVAPIEEAMFEVLCECGAKSCTEQFEIPIAEYESVRSDPALFVLVNGHQAPDVEDVVEDEGVFLVVRKRPGVPEEIARATDPR